MVRLFRSLGNLDDAARRISKAILADEWESVDAGELKELLRRLQDASRLNLDSPVTVPPRLSGKQASDLIDLIAKALKRSTGRPRKAADYVGERFDGVESALLMLDHVEGAPTTSFAESRLWEALELLKARAEARRTESTVRECFRARIYPRLAYWAPKPDCDDDAALDLRPKVFDRIYRAAVETIGLAGQPTERAVRNALQLSSRAQRRSRSRAAQEQVKETRAKLKAGTVILDPSWSFKEGQRILEGKSHT